MRWQKLGALLLQMVRSYGRAGTMLMWQFSLQLPYQWLISLHQPISQLQYFFVRCFLSGRCKWSGSEKVQCLCRKFYCGVSRSSHLPNHCLIPPHQPIPQLLHCEDRQQSGGAYRVAMSGYYAYAAVTM